MEHPDTQPATNEGVAQRTLAALLRRARHLYALRDLELTIPGAAHPYRIVLPADPDAPLDQFAAQVDPNPHPSLPQDEEERQTLDAATQARRAVAAGAHMPYWGLLWPSGLALAEALLARGHPAGAPTTVQRGVRALELGCGLGVTATAALDTGFTLIAADCFGEALLFTRYNTLRNVARMPDTLLLDWRTKAGRAACLAHAPFDLLLAADVLYEEDDIAPLLDIAPRLLAANGAFWLAEPGRRVSRAFVAAALARGWQDDETVYERAWPPDNDRVRVAVHRFTAIRGEK